MRLLRLSDGELRAFEIPGRAAAWCHALCCRDRKLRPWLARQSVVAGYWFLTRAIDEKVEVIQSFFAAVGPLEPKQALLPEAHVRVYSDRASGRWATSTHASASSACTTPEASRSTGRRDRASMPCCSLSAPVAHVHPESLDAGDDDHDRIIARSAPEPESVPPWMFVRIVKPSR